MMLKTLFVMILVGTLAACSKTEQPPVSESQKKEMMDKYLSGSDKPIHVRTAAEIKADRAREEAAENAKGKP